MSAITIQLPDKLVERLREHEQRLPEILELGLRNYNVETLQSFEGASEVLEFLAGLPSLQAILSLAPSERLQRRVEELLEKNRSGELTVDQEQEWERYEFLEHLVRMAKSKASARLGRDIGIDA